MQNSILVLPISPGLVKGLKNLKTRIPKAELYDMLEDVVTRDIQSLCELHGILTDEEAI